MRIDRLGKVGSTPQGWRASWHGVAANTPIQEVGVYRIQDTQSGIDSLGGSLLEMDGIWGSYPIATLATWESMRAAGAFISHHTQTSTSGPSPMVKDVARLLEAVLLEMPTYHLTTANCYVMTRTSLLMLQRLHPSVFACCLGSMSGELVDGVELAEPVWVGV
ncbi:hypothetical protein FRC12_017979, partial [Ceratobasidium sp. 428]